MLVALEIYSVWKGLWT